MPFYAVAVGKKKGIFTNWEECKEVIENFEKPVYKKFESIEEAYEFLDIYNNIYVYTDGSCINNGKENALCGIGIFFGKNDTRNVSKKLVNIKKHSNNVAELTAVIEALNILKSETKNIVIVTDSEYVIKCATTYGDKIALNNWKTADNKIPPNLKLLQELYAIVKSKNNIKFKHIEAHTNNRDIHSIGNYYADKLANEALGISENRRQKENKIFLNIPFSRKDEGKLLGTRWDAHKKSWYIFENNTNKNELLKEFGLKC